MRTPPLLFWLFSATAVAAGPHRRPLPKPERLVWTTGKQADVLTVKLAEGQGIRVESGRVVIAPGDPAPLQLLLRDAAPVFSRDPDALRARQAKVDPDGRLADLTLYLRIQGEDVQARGEALLRDPRVEAVFYPPAAAPPPADQSPTTPDLTDEQGYAGPAPDGLGFQEAASWLGARGAGVSIANIEYGWNPDHEDLGAVPGPAAWGEDTRRYPCHGTMVAGVLVAGDNGYGLTGLVPDAALKMVSPYPEPERYDIADAVDGAASLLQAGDVLLIEQQIVENDSYAPVEADPAVFDAIALAVAEGIVVVEPAANGGQDLDDPVWEGWFDRTVRDSGAILVGGGAPPGDLYDVRSWTGGSCYGSRVDLQGWYGRIATTSHSRDVDAYCPTADLFFPGSDPDQAYTSAFGGTSGAAPMVAAVVAAAQGVALASRGAPWAPLDLRAALVATGTPQQGAENIGPQPDLRRFLRVWGVK